MPKATVTKPTPRPVGAPRTLPDGTRNRTLRLTDAEYAALRAYLKELRKS